VLAGPVHAVAPGPLASAALVAGVRVEVRVAVLPREIRTPAYNRPREPGADILLAHRVALQCVEADVVAPVSGPLGAALVAVVRVVVRVPVSLVAVAQGQLPRCVVVVAVQCGVSLVVIFEPGSVVPGRRVLAHGLAHGLAGGGPSRPLDARGEGRNAPAP
jgi:hypothetical protein